MKAEVEIGKPEFIDTTKDKLAAIGAAVSLRVMLDKAEEEIAILVNAGDLSDFATRDRALSAVNGVLDAIVIFKEYVKA
jgi:hypothetical protein